MDDEEEDGGYPPAAKKFKVEGRPSAMNIAEEVKRTNIKNPSVDTSFLPDREREEKERHERELLRKEWLRKQETMKEETIEIIYSYWDGSGHRKSVNVSA